MQIKLFTIFDVPVFLHITGLFLLYVFFQMGFVIGFCLLLSVLAHEFGHVLVGKYYGEKTEKVIIMALGLAANMRITNPKKHELQIAAAGPIVNILIALALFIPWHFTPNNHREILELLIGGNFIFAIFNLFPIFPMDGGRIMRGLLLRKMTLLKATKTIATISTVLAVLLFPVAIVYMNSISIPIILVVVIILAWSEYSQVKRDYISQIMSQFQIER